MSSLRASTQPKYSQSAQPTAQPTAQQGDTRQRDERIQRAASSSWLAFLRAYLTPFWGRFALLAELLLGGIALQLIGPQLVSRFIDGATAKAAASTLITLALLALGAALVNLLASAWATYVGQDVGWAATNLLREDLAWRLLRLDMSYHNVHTPGELIERIDGDLSNLANFFSILIIQVLGSGGLLVGTLVVVWFTDWRVGLTLSLFMGIAMVVLIKMRAVAVPAGINERESSATFLGFLEERLAGVEDIRSNGGGAYVVDRFYVAMRAWFRQSVTAWTRRSSVWTVTTLLFGLGTALTLAVSAYLYLGPRAISLGTVYLFFQYTVLLEGPLEQITQQLQEFQKAASSLIRVRNLMRLAPEIIDGAAGAGALGIEMPEHDANGTEVPVAVGARGARPLATLDSQTPANKGMRVAFDHVTFAYKAGEEPILRDVSFALAPGQVMGLLGRTGSGKTTISRLLFRLYDIPGEGNGAVRLNGVDVRDLPLALLRQRVGLVTQEVQLFQASVRENLTFFDPGIGDERIHAVIAEMGLDDWFSRLPAGLDTRLDAGGGGLSAGEAQLLAFIRVFLRDPALVILDEPSSRLDLATERLIEHGVSALLRGRTGIIIAHRLATVQRTDMILTLDNGRVLEFGPREALAHDPTSRFHALLRIGLEDMEDLEDLEDLEQSDDIETLEATAEILA
ncbi:MAG: ABC transporter ATP-binding protein [Ktedonobacterales bacterium]